MSGVHRFLSRREKKHPQSAVKAEKKPDHFGGVFAIAENDSSRRKPDKEEEKKIKSVLERLRQHGVDTMVEANVEYALRSRTSRGDSDAAFRLLMLLQDTYEGIVQPYRPDTKLLGAENRESVTCYLDALLFAMFARLDSFEAMLYDSFADIPRKRLAGLLRLWVNLLRSGRLITTDVTKHLQDALASCGWADAAKLKQQDPSEAFTFITGQLELPLLTLKMDLYHTGKEDPQDDHKFINERLLEVALLDEPLEGNSVITLEDCLEHYFNNRIEVKRHMENQRRNTLKSAAIGGDAGIKAEKGTALHVEVVELDRPDTPLVQTPLAQTPLAETPSQSRSPMEKLRPLAGRKRADSIFSQRRVELTGVDPEKNSDDPYATLDAKGRKLSARTEVLMPAWQFFKLLPWYTDHMPTSDAQVAAHFSKKRPVLGICLKRYSYTTTGQARRLNTYIDIPLEIAVPNFVSDDSMKEDGPLVGNFTLMLQSVVCHRGVSVNSGHYVCLCRGTASNARRRGSGTERRPSSDSESTEDPWMRFDDLAAERITYVDIRQALKQETPYLLFYQVQPIDEDDHSISYLPSYADATSRSHSTTLPAEKADRHDSTGSELALVESRSNPHSERNASGTNAADFAFGPGRSSLDANRYMNARSSTSLSDGRRHSIAFDEASFAGSVITNPNSSSAPDTPSEEKANGFLAVANKVGSRRGSRQSKTSSTSRSRPSSTGPDNSSRFSLNMTKLTQRMSRGETPAVVSPVDADALEQKRLAEKEPAMVSAVAVSARNGSKDNLASSKPLPKLRKDKKKGSKGHHHGEDRDCTLM